MVNPYMDEFKVGEFGAATQAAEGLRDAGVGQADAISNINDARQLFQLAEKLGRDGSIIGQVSQ